MAQAPPPPISIEEIENLSEKQLRIRVNEWFAYLAACGNEQRAGVVAQAEFYMRELERRENAEVAARDFGFSTRDLEMANRSYTMEKSVIALIGLEIIIAIAGLWYGIHEGNKQQTVLEQMGKNTHDTAGILSGQGEVLGKMNTNTHDTVEAVGKLQKVQNDSLEAQKNTLKSIGKMNDSLQRQLDLAFAVSVLVTADEGAKQITVANLTKTGIYIWGGKYEDEAPVKFTDERFVGPGSQYSFFLDKIFEVANHTVPKGGPSKKVSLDFYLLSADAKPYIVHAYLEEKWVGDVLKLLPTIVSVKQQEWPSNIVR
jgi:hypothetical protein